MFTLIVYDGQDGVYRQCTMNIDSIEQAQKMMPVDYEILFVIMDDVDVSDSDGNELPTLEV